MLSPSRLMKALWAIAFVSTCSFEALANRRVALVIGNSAYKHTSPLANPKNDATDVSAALTALGFQVISGLDLDKPSFEGKVRDFSAALRNADMGLFFYAGHGIQVAGHNYLLPIDAKGETVDALDWEMVRLDLVQRTMERATTTNIIFLDACRNNPLTRNLARAMGTRSVDIGRGLARVEGGIGTLISFSTQPGNVALDGKGRNSPFAGSLVRHVGSAGEDISAVLIAVRNDVMKETNQQQVPWEHSALTARVYFSPPKEVKVPPAPVSAPVPAGPTVEQQIEFSFWASVKESKHPSVLQTYVDQYPNGRFVAIARALIDQHERAARAEEATRAQQGKANSAEVREPTEARPKKAKPAATGSPKPGKGWEKVVVEKKEASEQRPSRPRAEREAPKSAPLTFSGAANGGAVNPWSSLPGRD